MATITRHARERVKERIGVPSKSADKLANAAWEKGLKHTELKGHLKKYVDSKVIDSKATPRVYAQFLYLFSRDGKLRTVLTLPGNLQKIASALAKAKSKNL